MHLKKNILFTCIYRFTHSSKLPLLCFIVLEDLLNKVQKDWTKSSYWAYQGFSPNKNWTYNLHFQLVGSQVTHQQSSLNILARKRTISWVVLISCMHQNLGSFSKASFTLEILTELLMDDDIELFPSLSSLRNETFSDLFKVSDLLRLLGVLVLVTHVNFNTMFCGWSEVGFSPSLQVHDGVVGEDEEQGEGRRKRREGRSRGHLGGQGCSSAGHWPCQHWWFREASPCWPQTEINSVREANKICELVLASIVTKSFEELT